MEGLVGTAGPKIVAEIRITVDEKMNVSLEGPIENRMLMYGMLGMARDIVHDHAFKQQDRLITPAGMAETMAVEVSRALKGS